MKLAAVIFLAVLAVSSVFVGLYVKFVEHRDKEKLTDEERKVGSLFSLLSVAIGAIFALVAFILS
ncbi:hypothetical protein [Mameliella sp.]|uniref:hypothetical protein n=1 Tax=Mameliella sp. TaxID=1924940 RepID=UPI003BAD3F23